MDPELEQGMSDDRVEGLLIDDNYAVRQNSLLLDSATSVSNNHTYKITDYTAEKKNRNGEQCSQVNLGTESYMCIKFAKT